MFYVCHGRHIFVLLFTEVNTHLLCRFCFRDPLNFFPVHVVTIPPPVCGTRIFPLLLPAPQLVPFFLSGVFFCPIRFLLFFPSGPEGLFRRLFSSGSRPQLSAPDFLASNFWILLHSLCNLTAFLQHRSSFLPFSLFP